jgi:hypothetical protein
MCAETMEADQAHSKSVYHKRLKIHYRGAEPTFLKQANGCICVVQRVISSTVTPDIARELHMCQILLTTHSQNFSPVIV